MKRVHELESAMTRLDRVVDQKIEQKKHVWDNSQHASNKKQHQISKEDTHVNMAGGAKLPAAPITILCRGDEREVFEIFGWHRLQAAAGFQENGTLWNAFCDNC